MKLDTNEPLKECGVTNTIKIIGTKWTMHILYTLLDGKKRFGEIQRLLPGISSKTLSERLVTLEKERIITKKVYAEIPLHVDYTLTERGMKLDDIFKKMMEWGEQN